MIHETVTSLSAPDVLARAKAFFAERVPLQAAFPEKEGPGFVTLRGQGGEEVSLVVIPGSGANRVRASTLFFDQPLARFLATLPPGSEAA